MKIRVADIGEKPVELAAVEEIDSFPTLLDLQTSGEGEFLAPLAISLTIVREYDHLRVQGVIGTAVRLNCSRCLSECRSDIESRFTIFYTRAVDGRPEDEVELGEEDLIAATYDGEEIDFSAEIAEQVLLEIPYKPLCTEDCRGLCPHCGINLNSETCTCAAQQVSSAFSPLRGFKVRT